MTTSTISYSFDRRFVPKSPDPADPVDTAEYLVVTDGSVESFSLTYHHATYIQAMLAEKGVRTGETSFAPSLGSPAQIIDRLAANRKLRVVHFLLEGIRSLKTLVEYSSLKWLARALKARRPDLLLVLSGDYATHAPEWILERIPGLDVCIRFEPFFPARDLCVSYDGDRSTLETVRGITFRAGNNEVIHTPPTIWPDAPRGAELDVLPSPFSSGTIDPRKFVFYYLTSIGCPYFCRFCWCNNALTKQRCHSVDRVIQDLQIIDDIYRFHIKAGITPVGLFRIFNKAEGLQNLRVMMLYDLLLTPNRRRTDELTGRMAAERFALKFGFEARADRVDRGSLQQLFDAGFRFAHFGLESADPQTLRRIQKVKRREDDGDYRPEEHFLEQVRTEVANANEIGMHTVVSVLIGLPGQTAEQFRQTAKFAMSLGVDDVNQNPLGLIPGIRMFEENREHYLGEIERRFFQIRPMEFDYSEVWGELENMYDQTDTMVWGRGALTTSLHLPDPEPGGVYTRPGVIVADNPNALTSLAPLFTVGAQALVAKEEDAFVWDLWEEHAPLVVFPVYGIHSSTPPAKRPRQKPFDGIDLIRVPFGAVVDPEGVFPENRPPRVAEPANPSWAYLLETVYPEDVAALSRFCEAVRARGTLVVPPWIANNGFYSLDACRWCSHPCPGRLGRVWRATADGTMATCWTGSGLVPANSSQQDAIREMTAVLREVEQRRGCASCPAEAVCSKCPSVGAGLTEEAYCKLRQELGSVVGLYELNESYEVHRDLHQRLGGALEAPIEFSVSQVPDRGLLVADVTQECGAPAGEPEAWLVYKYQESYWLRAQQSLRIFEVPEPIAAGAELRASGFSIEQALSYVDQRYELDPQEFLEVMEIFNERGYLKEQDIS